MLAPIGFLSHLARQIRVEIMLRTVFDETQTSPGRIFPAGEKPDALSAQSVFGHGPGLRRIKSGSSGFLLTVDSAGVCAAATGAGGLVVFEAAPGDSLVRGVPFARAGSAAGGKLENEAFADLSQGVAESIGIGSKRTSVQDATLGLQQLLDIACREFSPGIDDATTAVHAVGHISSLLYGLADRSTGSYLVRDDGRHGARACKASGAH